MSFPYDQSIIAFFSLFFYALFALFYFSLWWGNHKRIAGLGYWTINLVLQVVGKAIAISPLLPNTQFATVLGYVLTSGGAVCFYFGLAAFTNTSINKKFYYCFFVAFALLIAWSVHSIPNSYGRSLIYGLAVLFISTRYLSLIWKNLRSNPWFFKPFLLLFVLYSIMTGFNILRISLDVVALLRGELLETFDSPLLRINQFLTLALLIGVNFCTLMLTNNKLLSDLAKESQEKDAAMEKLKVTAEHDRLTGLLNRGALDAYLESLVGQSKESGRWLVSMVDIDNFKAINDTYGHEAGDLVLYRLASIFSSSIRKQDTVGRWGGDEFLFILKDVSSDEAADLVRRLHEHVALFDWSGALHLPGLKVCISSGYYLYNGNETKTEILRITDSNLYAAKQQGRNQWVGS